MAPFRKLNPSLESLETKALLSTAHPAIAAEVASTSQGTTGLLLGKATTPIPSHPIVDGNTVFSLSGSGNVAGMGRVRLAGALTKNFPYPEIAVGQGALVLSNGHGTLTLRVIGRQQNAPGPDNLYHATVQSGTGQYAQLQLSGTAEIDIIAMPPRHGSHSVSEPLSIRLNLH